MRWPWLLLSLSLPAALALPAVSPARGGAGVALVALEALVASGEGQLSRGALGALVARARGRAQCPREPCGECPSVPALLSLAGKAPGGTAGLEATELSWLGAAVVATLRDPPATCGDTGGDTDGDIHGDTDGDIHGDTDGDARATTGSWASRVRALHREFVTGDVTGDVAGDVTADVTAAVAGRGGPGLREVAALLAAIEPNYRGDSGHQACVDARGVLAAATRVSPRVGTGRVLVALGVLVLRGHRLCPGDIGDSGDTASPQHGDSSWHLGDTGDSDTARGDTDTRHDDIATCLGDTDTRHGDIATLDGDTDTRHGDIATLVGDTDTQHGDTATLAGDMDTWHGDIATRLGDMDTWHGDIATRLRDTGTWHGDIATRLRDTGTRHGDIATRLGDTDSRHGDIATLVGDTDTQHGDIATLDGDTDAWHGDIATLDGDTDTRHGDIATLAGDTDTRHSDSHARDIESQQGPTAPSSGDSGDNVTVPTATNSTEPGEQLGVTERYLLGTLTALALALVPLVALALVLCPRCPLCSRCPRGAAGCRRCRRCPQRWWRPLLDGLAAGALSGDALLHVLPEALGAHGHSGGDTRGPPWELLAVLGGLYGGFVLERLLGGLGAPPEEVKDGDPAPDPAQSAQELTNHGSGRAQALLLSAGGAVHRLADGLALGSAFAASGSAGAAAGAGLALHELPRALSDALVLSQSGLGTRRTVALAVAAALPVLPGVVAGLALGAAPAARTWLAGLGGGFLLHLALCHMVPAMLSVRSPSPWALLGLQSAGLLGGWALLLLLALNEQGDEH